VRRRTIIYLLVSEERLATPCIELKETKDYDNNNTTETKEVYDLKKQQEPCILYSDRGGEASGGRDCGEDLSNLLTFDASGGPLPVYTFNCLVFKQQ